MIDASIATLRRRHDELEALADAIRGTTVVGTLVMVVKTFAESTYPTAAGRFFACHPVTITGDEAEGATVTPDADLTQTLYAANAGTAIPPSGTFVVVTLFDGRWGFVYNG